MFCGKCGVQCADNIKFCWSCGFHLPKGKVVAPTAPPPAAKSSDRAKKPWDFVDWAIDIIYRQTWLPAWARERALQVFASYWFWLAVIFTTWLGAIELYEFIAALRWR